MNHAQNLRRKTVHKWRCKREKRAIQPRWGALQKSGRFFTPPAALFLLIRMHVTTTPHLLDEPVGVQRTVFILFYRDNVKS